MGVCGESAANPLLSIVFAGVGVDSVSAAPSAVDAVSEALRAVSLEQAHEAASIALAATTAQDAESGVRALFEAP